MTFPQPEVAVDERRLVAGRDVLGQPRDEALHRLDLLGLRGAVLLGPAVKLAGEVVARPPEVGEAERPPVGGVQAGQHVDERLVDQAALARRHAGNRGVGEDAPVHAVHDVEGRADDRVVFAQGERARHRVADLAQGRDDPVLPVDGMGGRQELARGLPSEHVLPAAGRQMIGRIRLAPPELAHFERAAEALHAGAHVALERADVKSVRLEDFGGLGDHPLGSPPVRAPV